MATIDLIVLGILKKEGIVKKEGRFLGWAGIGIGILLGCAAGFALFPRGFNLLFYAAAIV